MCVSTLSVNGWHESFESHSYVCNMSVSLSACLCVCLQVDMDVGVYQSKGAQEGLYETAKAKGADPTSAAVASLVLTR